MRTDDKVALTVLGMLATISLISISECAVIRTGTIHTVPVVYTKGCENVNCGTIKVLHRDDVVGLMANKVPLGQAEIGDEIKILDRRGSVFGFWPQLYRIPDEVKD